MKKADFLSTYQNQINRSDRFLYFAPGSVNIMGDHTDYTGGQVLTAAISQGTYLFVRLLPENEIRLTSKNIGEQITIPVGGITKPQSNWTDYAVGVLNELEKRGWKKQGLELIYFGDIPLNAGLSASASMEMVTAYAINNIFELGISAKELALLSQKAENDFAGVNYGSIDQYPIALAKSHHALLLDCHTLSQREIPVLPDGYQFVAVNSNVRHAEVNSVYHQRVAELHQVKEILNSFFEVPYLGSLLGEDNDWLDKLVEDPLLKKRLRHVVNENTRVQLAAELLENKAFKPFGKLMYDSHDSLAFDFEVSCKELDTLVKIASQTEGVAGARMTGVGLGGCTINLVKTDAITGFQQKIMQNYNQETGLEASVLPLSLEGTITEITN